MENIIYKTNGYDRMISGKMKQVIKLRRLGYIVKDGEDWKRSEDGENR